MQVPLSEGVGLAADVGTALHEATQYWTAHRHEERVGPYNMTPEEMSDWIVTEWWPFKLERQRLDAGLKKDYKRTFGNTLLLLQAIRDHRFWDQWEVARLPDGSPAIELPFRIVHKSLGYFIHPVNGKRTWIATQGKIDWILKNKFDGRFMVTDLKTTIQDAIAANASFRHSGQAGQYGLVLNQALGIDWRRWGMEVTYLVGEFGEFGEPEVTPRDYQLSPTEVEESIRAKQERLERMIKMARERFFPRRTHGCSFYQTPCGFLDICHRREPEFLAKWFSVERHRFATEARVYEPFWTLEA